jgi:hypothetical protein
MISVRKQPRLEERAYWWLLDLAERTVLTSVPRGPFRRRLLHRIDQMLARTSEAPAMRVTELK